MATSEMAVMDHKGDSKHIWDPAKPDEVAAARAAFDALKKKGYLAYEVEETGKKGKLILKFNPAAGKIIMSPQMVGG